MTLWDLMFGWLRRHRPHRWTRMVAWPYWSKQQRFNIIQRWAMRRGLWLVVALAWLKVNPFSPLSIAAVIITGTCVMTEHRTHKKQHRALHESERIVWKM